MLTHFIAALIGYGVGTLVTYFTSARGKRLIELSKPKVDLRQR